MKKWVWVAVIIASLFTGYAVAYALKPSFFTAARGHHADIGGIAVGFLLA